MEFEKLIENRRSVRSFKSGVVINKEIIDEIMKATSLAPSWKNSQTGRYYAVISPDMVKKLREETLPFFNQKSTLNAAAYIVTTYKKDISGFTKGNPDNELGNEWGAYDLGLQNSYMILKASSLGLDTLIMGLRDTVKLKELLSINDDEVVVAVIALGYREGDVKLPLRKSPEEICTIF